MLSFEGEKIQGAQNISNKLSSLPFQQCKHDISTVDCQPSGPAGGMMVFVSICNYQARNTLLNSARYAVFRARKLCVVMLVVRILSVCVSGHDPCVNHHLSYLQSLFCLLVCLCMILASFFFFSRACSDCLSVCLCMILASFFFFLICRVCFASLSVWLCIVLASFFFFLPCKTNSAGSAWRVVWPLSKD